MCFKIEEEETHLTICNARSIIYPVPAVVIVHVTSLFTRRTMMGPPAHSIKNQDHEHTWPEAESWWWLELRSCHTESRICLKARIDRAIIWRAIKNRCFLSNLHKKMGRYLRIDRWGEAFRGSIYALVGT